MREKQVNQKKPGLDDLGNSQFIQMSQDAKMKRFTVRRAWSGGKAEGVAGPFANTLERLKVQKIESQKNLFVDEEWGSEIPSAISADAKSRAGVI